MPSAPRAPNVQGLSILSIRQKNSFSRLFPAWLGLWPVAPGPTGREGLKIDFFGGAAAPPSHPGDVV